MSFSASAMVKQLRVGTDASLPPVFIFPAVGGTTACWDELLRQFPNYKRTIYGLSDPHLCGHPEGMSIALDDLIECYFQAVKSKQAEGPYTFMAYSFGMNDMWATAGVIIKKGGVVEQLVCLDPNAPAWNKADKMVSYAATQLAPVVGAPKGLIKFGMGFAFAPMLKSDWSTTAKREKTLAKLTKLTDPMMIEQFLLQVEDDSKVEFFTDNYMKNTKALGKGATMLANASQLVASKIEGMDSETAMKFVERWSFHLPRFTQYTPYVMPKSVKITMAFFDRSHKWAGKFPAGKKYSTMQGFERFCEGGEAQIDEMIFPSTPLPPDNVYAKGAFMSKTFSLHYRFMHDASVFKLLEKKIFEPLGLL